MSRKVLMVAAVCAAGVALPARDASACGLFGWLFGCCGARRACFAPPPCAPPCPPPCAPCAPSCAPCGPSPCGPGGCAPGLGAPGFGPGYGGAGFAPTFAPAGPAYPASPCGPGGCGMTTRYAPRAAYQSFSPDIPPIVYKPRRQQTSFFHPAIESTAEVIEARQSRTASFRPVSTPINAGWGSY